jgi:hypothetical protein
MNCPHCGIGMSTAQIGGQDYKNHIPGGVSCVYRQRDLFKARVVELEAAIINNGLCFHTKHLFDSDTRPTWDPVCHCIACQLSARKALQEPT